MGFFQHCYLAMFRIFAVSILLASSSWADANEIATLVDGSTVIMNEGKMPLCWVSGKTAVTFEWNNPNDRYQRNMKAYPAGNSLSDCKNSANLVERYRGVPVNFSTKTLFGKKVPSYLRLAFGQITTGATVFRNETTPEAYLRKYPVSKWGLGTTLNLTKKFGVGFASQLYKAYLESQPGNLNFKQDVKNYLSNRLLNLKLGEKSGNITYILVPGLGNSFTEPSPPGDVGMKEILDDFMALGLRTKAIQTERYARNLDNNVDLIEREVIKTLNTGSDVVIVANSRGVPETLTAISRLSDQLAEGTYPGKILGFMNMSGLVYGSFIGDWAESNPYVVAAWLASENPVVKKLLPYPSMRLSAAMALSTSHISQYTNEFKNKLPQNTVYLNLVGTLGGTGLSQDGMLSNMQKLARKYISGFGANDGYIEYPRTVIPKSMATKNYSVVFDADHLLWTGSFNQKKLTDISNRRKVIASLLNTLLDR